MTQAEPLLVAIDDGYAQTKLYGMNPQGGEAVRFMVRSSVRAGRYGMSSLSGQGRIGAYRTEEGEDFTASEETEAESTQFDSFHVSTMNRTLVHHALALAGYGGRQVSLITGLPLADYFMDGVRDQVKVDQKKANLMKGVTNVGSDSPLATITQVQVGCQAIAAFVDYLVGDDLEERDVPGGRVAVIDIGGRTTDIALVVDGQRFDESRSDTANIGVLDVYTALGRSIRSKFGVKDRHSLAVMDHAVRQGTIQMWNKPQDISDLVTAAIQEQEVKIAREVERRLGSASSVDVVLFVGGGSALFRGIAARFPNGEMGKDPEYANCRGLFKYYRKQT